MATNNVNSAISGTQARQGAKAIVNKVGTLAQTLKGLKGIYSERLWASKDVPKNCANMTVAEYFAAMGVQRFVSDKGVKGDITPGTLAAGWPAALKNESGTMCILRNVNASYVDEKGEKRKVYTAEEGTHIDGKPISRLMLVPVAAAKWSIVVILRGLLQGCEYAKHEKTMLQKDLDFEGYEKVYIRKKDADGRETLELIEVSKDKVTF